ncbi:MAG: hypothetical protein ABF586_06205 [Sporolactobacillus sp.]
MIDDEVYGMPSYNIGLNDKKPYLKMRTKKSDVPLLVSPEEAVLRRKLFSWLGNQAPFVSNQIKERDLFFASDDQKLNETIHFMFVPDTKGDIVNYYEKIPFSCSKQLKRPFEMKNIINAFEWQESSGHYILAQDREPIRNPDTLLELTSRLFFKNHLRKNSMLFEKPKIMSGVFPGEMLNLFFRSKQAFYDFFVKGTDIMLRAKIDSLSQQSIEIQLLKTIAGTNAISLGQAFNLRLGWLKYFEIPGSEEKVGQLAEFVANLKAKFNQDEIVDIDRSDEFYFLAGQVSSYLLSQSETSNKNYGMFEGILRAKTPELLKHQIDNLFRTYKHKIEFSIEGSLLTNVLAPLQAYEFDQDSEAISNNDRDYLLAGILAKNMFHRRKKGGETK